MFSGRKASPTNIHFSPDRCAFARCYGCYSTEWKEKKRKLEHIRVKLCMFLFSAAAAAHTFFHFLCNAGSEIGAVLPTVVAPSKSGKSSAPISLALKSPIIFNGHRFTCTLFTSSFALIRGS
ncbi:hypothetical protein CEXT_577741 [Caerostris extrusa]|uniref:Uncharacterized protein n=1 Tax=Caerostris extrusa TaxID=172846 RepID=A0AAV4SPS3_CAEEX|nr:hypothetical protein CEXT_577741 [Caerostris extrusa]